LIEEIYRDNGEYFSTPIERKYPNGDLIQNPVDHHPAVESTASHDHLISSTSNPTSVESTPSHDHHLIYNPVNHHPAVDHQMDMQYSLVLLQLLEQLEQQNTPNRPNHQFPGPGGNNKAATSPDMAANRPDHQFQGGKNKADLLSKVLNDKLSLIDDDDIPRSNLLLPKL
jgi:hypothetical protein